MLLVTHLNICNINAGDYVSIQDKWIQVEYSCETHLRLHSGFCGHDGFQSRHYSLAVEVGLGIAAYVATTDEEIMQAKLSCCS